MEALKLVGKVFGFLEVIERTPNEKLGYTTWKCKCVCGNDKIVKGYDLTRGHVKSCGCYNEQICEDLSGKVFGLLTIVKKLENKDANTRWLCKCVCGKEVELSRGSLTRKRIKVKSCGCYAHFTRESNKNYNGVGELSGRYFASVRCRARQHKLEFGITKEYIRDLFLKQDKRCALSGVELKFHSRQLVFDGNASLDRIDSAKGYVEGNVQWVHKTANFMKQRLSDEEFIEWCGIVVNFQSLKRRIKDDEVVDYQI